MAQHFDAFPSGSARRYRNCVGLARHSDHYKHFKDYFPRIIYIIADPCDNGAA
jgi:hypothetical protein